MSKLSKESLCIMHGLATYTGGFYLTSSSARLLAVAMTEALALLRENEAAAERSALSPGLLML